MHSIAKIQKKSDLFNYVEGVFYRTIDPIYRDKIIAGSRLPGRYSTSEQPTLYLSATQQGMNAAINVHKANRSTEKEVRRIKVTGDQIFDLLDEAACKTANIELCSAISPWQPDVSEGRKPRSWAVRDRIIQLGGVGLIDPSRQIPGLWHLVLFQWNQENAPQVEVL